MRTLKLILTSFLILFLAGTVSAAEIQVHSVSGIPNYQYIQDGQGQKTSYAGEFAISSDDLDIAPYGYCVEQGALIGGGIFELTEPLVDITGNFINAAWLVHTFRPQITTDDQRAALQLAVWDVLYGWDDQANAEILGGDGLINDISGAQPDAVQDYLDIITAAYNPDIVDSVLGNGYKVAKLRFNGDDQRPSIENIQDILVRTVPEPGSMILFGFGLLSLGAVGRRKK